MSFTQISVLVPTRGRIGRLETMIGSFERTIRVRSSEIVFRIDDDDQETSQYLARWRWPVVVGPRYDGYRSTPRYLDEAYAYAHGDVLMVGNDDMIFKTTGWDLTVLEAANQYPDGLFDLGVQTLNTDHFPFSIISRTVVEILGFIYDPRIFWGDIFLRDVMDAFGRAVKLPTVHVEHDWAGYKPDSVFAAAEALKTTIGTSTYWEMHREVVKEAVAKLCCVGVAT